VGLIYWFLASLQGDVVAVNLPALMMALEALNCHVSASVRCLLAGQITQVRLFGDNRNIFPKRGKLWQSPLKPQSKLQ